MPVCTQTSRASWGMRTPSQLGGRRGERGCTHGRQRVWATHHQPAEHGEQRTGTEHLPAQEGFRAQGLLGAYPRLALQRHHSGLWKDSSPDPRLSAKPLPGRWEGLQQCLHNTINHTPRTACRVSTQAEVEGGGLKGALGPQDTQDTGKSAAYSQENKLFF